MKDKKKIKELKLEIKNLNEELEVARANQCERTNRLSPLPAGHHNGLTPPPTLKIIDITSLAGSGILCIHKGTGAIVTISEAAIDFVKYNGVATSYESTCHRKKLKPLFRFRNAWVGGRCPIPEGLDVRLHYQGGSKKEFSLSYADMLSDFEASNRGGAFGISAVEFIGISDGYKLPDS